MKRAKQHRGGLPPDLYLSKMQIKKLLQYARAKADKARILGSRQNVVNLMILELLLGAGLRAGELCRLQLRDLPYIHGKYVLHIKNSKGGVDRTVEISSDLSEKLKQFITEYRKGCKLGSPVIPSQRGYRCLAHSTNSSSGISYPSLYGRVRRLGEKSGIGKLHPHMLRHTNLTMLYNVKEDIRFCQSQAGHKSIETTARYTQTSPRSCRRQIEGLNKELNRP